MNSLHGKTSEVIFTKSYIRLRYGISIQNIFGLLCDSLFQAKTAQEILSKLQTGTTAERSESLRRLAELSVDYTFAQEFINKKGLHLLIDMIESGD